MKKILILAAAVIVAGAAYAVSAGGDKPADATPKSGAASCMGAKAANAAEGGPACCRKGAAAAAKTALCKVPHDKEVVLTGVVVCEKCDLQTAKSCTPAFKAEGRSAALKICTATKDVPALQKAGEVEVKGYVHPGPDGSDEIEVVSFNKKPAKA